MCHVPALHCHTLRVPAAAVGSAAASMPLHVELRSANTRCRVQGIVAVVDSRDVAIGARKLLAARGVDLAALESDDVDRWQDAGAHPPLQQTNPKP